MKDILITALVIAIAVIALDRAREVHAQASIAVSTQGDVTGAGTTVALGVGTARWVQVIALSANGAVIRCANSTASTSRGAPIAAGGGFLFPPSENQNLYYDLSRLYCYAANGDKYAVVWGN
jgi:hypothetical protein